MEPLVCRKCGNVLTDNVSFHKTAIVDRGNGQNRVNRGQFGREGESVILNTQDILPSAVDAIYDGGSLSMLQCKGCSTSLGVLYEETFSPMYVDLRVKSVESVSERKSRFPWLK